MDSEENATSCSVCREIYSDPRCLACGHSFCLKCLKGVAGNKQTFACPICRFDVRLGSTNIDQLPKNFVLCNVIEAREKKHPSMCLDHNKSLDLFCQRCNVVICSKCLSMQHKGHSIEDIEIIFIERNKQYGAFLESTRHLGLITEEKRDAVKQLRISMEKNIDCISKTVENTFKKWNDALQKQHSAILSYLHQERDQKRQMFLEAERILEGSMTTVTELDNEISKLRSKDTLYVVQQYGSIKARLEDTERKLLQEIETCLTPTDNLVIEVYAPWIEEAINNIKHIDMKHTQARSGRQKIAEIQEENFNLKRECEKLRITLQELEKRKTNEVENLEYLNQCLDSLVQRLYVHVVSGATTLPRTIEQPADIKPEPSLAKRYKHAQEICAQFTKVRKELSASKQEMANKIKEYEQNYEKLRAEHQNFKTAYTALYERYNEANSDLSVSKQEMANKIEEYEQNYEKLRAEHQNLTTAYTTLQKRYNEDNAMICFAREELELLRKKRNEEKRKYEEDLQRNREQIKQLKKDINELLNRERISRKDEELHGVRQDLENTRGELGEKIRKYEEDLERKTEKIKHLEAEKNDLLNRLSSKAAARMTYNNPNISDLSDQDRPTKISERYAELYDNQWTDAFQNLQKSYEMSDTKIIEVLLDVLYTSFDVCKRIRKQREALVRYLTEYVGEAGGDVIVCEVMTILKVAKKKNIAEMQKDYKKRVHEVLETKYSKVLQCIGPYVNECVELCLLMNIQDPALELKGVVLGENPFFDVAVFRPYTKSGSRIEHIVWPALYLFNKGPLLCRGVAQGTRDSSEGHKSTIIKVPTSKEEH